MTAGLPAPEGSRRNRSGRRPWVPPRSSPHAGPVATYLTVDGRTVPGVLLPMRRSPAWHVPLFALLGAALTALAGFAVVAAARGEAQALLALVPAVPAAALFGGGAYAVGRSRRRRGAGIGLTPTHVVLANYPRPIAVRWEQVRRIGSPSIRWGVPPGPVPVTDLVAVVVSDPTLLAALPGWARRLGKRSLGRTGEVTLATIPDTAWAMDPAVAYHTLRWYLSRPALRAELSGDAALRRISRAALTG